jgi:hypothetical protein
MMFCFTHFRKLLIDIHPASEQCRMTSILSLGVGSTAFYHFSMIVLFQLYISITAAAITGCWSWGLAIIH